MNGNRPHWADTAIAIFTGLMLITYITGNYFSCQQLKLTQRTLEEIRKGGTDTHDLVVAAKTEADNSKTLAEQAQKQTSNTDALALATGRTANAAEASANAAKSAADTSAKQLVLTYRPWITAESCVLDRPLQFPPASRFSMNVTIVLKNSGLSVARDGLVMPDAEPDDTATLSRDSYKSCDLARNMQATKAKSTPWETGFVLAPADRVKIPVGMGADNISENQVRSGKFYILGCVVYRDQFSREHHTRFCFQPTKPVTDASLIEFTACGWFGEAN